MTKKLKYKNEEIIYRLTRKKVKNINMRIRDGIVNISANNLVPIEYIESILIQKWQLIQNKLLIKPNKYLEDNIKSYTTGEYYLYLGKSYKLNIILNKNFNIQLNDELKIYTDDSSPNNIKNILNKWYLQKIEYIFKDSLIRNYGLIKNYTSIYPELKYRKMTSSWGNCKMPSGIITLNKNLIKAPIEAIDYVVMHELVHLVHQNHSSDFYNLLEILMPDWKYRKNLLYE